MPAPSRDAHPHMRVCMHAGVYVWGKDWIQAKTQAECYDYLFEAAVKMRGLGLDHTRPPAPVMADTAAAAVTANGAVANGHQHAEGPAAKRVKTRHLPTAIVLDIEGTVAPISYVADVMFPYARKHVRAHLEATFDSAETQADVQLIREQVGWRSC